MPATSTRVPSPWPRSVDAPPEDGHSVSYVVFVNRTRTDILKGAFGGMKRKLTGP